MKVNRKAVLETLEAVQPGLSHEGTIEQSDCFAFRDGRVFTYDDEIACSAECELDITGAVLAKPLLELLQKLPEEVIELEIGEQCMRVKGQRRGADIRMHHDVLLAVDQIPWPDENDWRELPPDFNEAAEVVRQCVSKEDAYFALTCVHITPDYMEACDNVQATRYPLATGFESEMLIRSRAMLHLVNMVVTECAETDTWVHFRNAAGLTLSCRRYNEPYENLDDVVTVGGKPLVLPDGLEAAADIARIFSRDNVEDDKIEICLDKNRLTVIGEGQNGRYKEVKRLAYDGERLRFRIAPGMLKSVLARSKECHLAADRMWVDAGKFVYVTVLEPKYEENNENE